MAFDLDGAGLPADYSYGLMSELVGRLPWIESEPSAGVHPLRAAKTDANDLLLPRRAKLVLRLPEPRTKDAAVLCGQKLSIAGSSITIGASKSRPLLPFGTLYAHFVISGDGSEQDFLDEVGASLKTLQAPCEMVCGKRRVIRSRDGEIAGYGLMLHGLGPEQSIRVQRIGLGHGRLMGCGIFVGHKSVAAVG